MFAHCLLHRFCLVLQPKVNVKMQDLQIIDRLVADGKLSEAIAELTVIIASAECVPGSDVADLLFRRGKLYWRLGNRSRATSDYARSAGLAPHGPASMALEQARDIEAFFNPDIYNP